MARFRKGETLEISRRAGELEPVTILEAGFRAHIAAPRVAHQRGDAPRYVLRTSAGTLNVQQESLVRWVENARQVRAAGGDR